jgi:DNA-damage-inducible protein D
MMTNEIKNTHIKSFEALRRLNENGAEFWYARDLQAVFEYASWQKFEALIGKAQLACKTSGYEVHDHFNQVVKMVDIGSGAQRPTKDYQLSRYAATSSCKTISWRCTRW